jgi:hypothetical protein
MKEREKSRGRKLCVYMANHIDDALDELVSQLLGCSAVLSQMISRMVEWESAGHSAPDAAPIPTVAHEPIGSVLDEVKRRHSRRDLIVAASIVGEATNAMTENIFFVPLPEEGSSADDASGTGRDGTLGSLTASRAPPLAERDRPSPPCG